MNSPLTDPKTLLSEIGTQLSEAEDTLKRGEQTTLEGVDTLVQRLCEHVATLSEEDARTFRPVLDELYTRIEAIGNTLRSQQQDLQNQMSSVQHHRDAAAAYLSGAATHKDDH